MLAVLVLLLTIVETPFGSSVDRALSLARTRDWKTSASALDRALIEDPAAFEANNLHYLRGRAAEELQDWEGAVASFERVGPKNPLRPLAAYRGARAALRSGTDARARPLIDELPSDFPASLKVQLAREAPAPLALRLLAGVNTREAKLLRAFLGEDSTALWALLRENNADDAALESARWLLARASTARDWRDLGAAFMAQRQFEMAADAFNKIAGDSDYAAEVRYQLARIRFLKNDYEGAIEIYREVASSFPATSWRKDAEYQIGSAYWRLRQYENAERAYLEYIERYKKEGTPESAITDLVDIYRSMGAHAKALSLIDASLKTRASAGTRQVLIFSKAKILFAQQKYSTALQEIRRLKGVRLQSKAGGTSADEVLYFEALSLSRMGQASSAAAVWRKLAGSPLTYYGQRAAELLGIPRSTPSNSPSTCGRGVSSDPVLDRVLSRLDERRRPLLAKARDARAREAMDAVNELVFLRLWDDASLWMDRARRPDAAFAADLAYAGGRFARVISHAGRLASSSRDAERMSYPAAYSSEICDAAVRHGVDPAWLHAIVWQESKYDPLARSGAAARGLMQFIPETAEAIAPAVGFASLGIDGLYDPKISIELGAYYWAALLAEFKTPELALAAYNGGPVNVRRWRDKWHGAGGSGPDGAIPPSSEREFFVSDIGFVETKRYVQAVFGARAAYGRSN